MMKIKTITICCSCSFYEPAVQIAKELKKLGFKAVLPQTARKMAKDGNFNDKKYKVWLKDQSQYFLKEKLMKDHFKKIEQSDGVLIINLEKNGVKGYIGGNTLMEMTVAFYLKKSIFILNDSSENKLFQEEILGMFPHFLNGDVNNLKQAIS